MNYVTLHHGHGLRFLVFQMALGDADFQGSYKLQVRVTDSLVSSTHTIVVFGKQQQKYTLKGMDLVWVQVRGDTKGMVVLHKYHTTFIDNAYRKDFVCS